MRCVARAFKRCLAFGDSRAKLAVVGDRGGQLGVELSNLRVELADFALELKHVGARVLAVTALGGDVAGGLDRAEATLAAELVGVAQRAMAMSIEYAKDRKQFNTPIGAYQAVSHTCAQMLYDTEGARSATYFAAWAADADPAQAVLAGATAELQPTGFGAALGAGQEVAHRRLRGRPAAARAHQQPGARRVAPFARGRPSGA